VNGPGAGPEARLLVERTNFLGQSSFLSNNSIFGRPGIVGSRVCFCVLSFSAHILFFVAFSTFDRAFNQLFWHSFFRHDPFTGLVLHFRSSNPRYLSFSSRLTESTNILPRCELQICYGRYCWPRMRLLLQLTPRLLVSSCGIFVGPSCC